MRFHGIHTLSDYTLNLIIESIYEKYSKSGLDQADKERFKAYVREQNRRKKKAKSNKLKYK